MISPKQQRNNNQFDNDNLLLVLIQIVINGFLNHNLLDIDN